MGKYFSIKSISKIIAVILAIIMLNFVLIQLNAVIEDNSVLSSADGSLKKTFPSNNQEIDNVEASANKSSSSVVIEESTLRVDRKSVV